MDEALCIAILEVPLMGMLGFVLIFLNIIINKSESLLYKWQI